MEIWWKSFITTLDYYNVPCTNVYISQSKVCHSHYHLQIVSILPTKSQLIKYTRYSQTLSEHNRSQWIPPPLSLVYRCSWNIDGLQQTSNQYVFPNDTNSVFLVVKLRIQKSRICTCTCLLFFFHSLMWLMY
jgi:hypothetical protein